MCCCVAGKRRLLHVPLMRCCDAEKRRLLHVPLMRCCDAEKRRLLHVPLMRCCDAGKGYGSARQREWRRLLPCHLCAVATLGKATGRRVSGTGVASYINLHPTPITQHPTPNTHHPTPITQHPTPITQHPTPNTHHPTPITHHPTPNTQHPTPNKKNGRCQWLMAAPFITRVMKKNERIETSQFR